MDSLTYRIKHNKASHLDCEVMEIVKKYKKKKTIFSYGKDFMHLDKIFTSYLYLIKT